LAGGWGVIGETQEDLKSSTSIINYDLRFTTTTTTTEHRRNWGLSSHISFTCFQNNCISQSSQLSEEASLRFAPLIEIIEYTTGISN
jgi:hypothetical protein